MTGSINRNWLLKTRNKVTSYHCWSRYPRPTKHWSCRGKRSQRHGKQPSMHLWQRSCAYVSRNSFSSTEWKRRQCFQAHTSGWVSFLLGLYCWVTWWPQLITMMWECVSEVIRSSRRDIWGTLQGVQVSLLSWGDIPSLKERGSCWMEESFVTWWLFLVPIFPKR